MKIFIFLVMFTCFGIGTKAFSYTKEGDVSHSEASIVLMEDSLSDFMDGLEAELEVGIDSGTITVKEAERFYDGFQDSILDASEKGGPILIAGSCGLLTVTEGYVGWTISGAGVGAILTPVLGPAGPLIGAAVGGPYGIIYRIVRDCAFGGNQL